jgi:hypothetical protein
MKQVGHGAHREEIRNAYTFSPKAQGNTLL